jgi:hypothetical protein
LNGRLLTNTRRSFLFVQLSKYQRCELQFSGSEESFLHSTASLHPDSLYSGKLTHLNLDRVHEVEGKLVEVHEGMKKAHGMLSALAAVTPLQHQLQQFLHRRSASGRTPSTANDDAIVRMQTLLETLRDACFSLQSLGVLLPSSTAFPQSSHSAPVGWKGREWKWLVQLEALVRRGGKSVPVAELEGILARAEREEQYYTIKLGVLQEELQYFRSTQRFLTSSVMKLLKESEELVGRFHQENNQLYAESARELHQCVEDWQRNSERVSVQRLLTTLQSIFPSVKELLRDDQRSSHSSGGLAPVASQLQFDLDEALERFQQRTSDLERQQRNLDRDAQEQPSADDGAARRAPPRQDDRSQLRSSTGRSTKRNDAELPPFQF